MKLLFTQDALVNAGAERSHLEILSRFSEEVELVFVYFYPKHDLKEAYEKAGIRLIFLDIPEGYHFGLAISRLVKLIRIEKPNLLISSLYRADQITRIASWITGVPLIGTLVNDSYGPLAWSDKKGLKYKLVHWLDRLTAGIPVHWIANAQALADSHVSTLGLDGGKISVVYRGREVVKAGRRETGDGRVENNVESELESSLRGGLEADAAVSIGDADSDIKDSESSSEEEDCHATLPPRRAGAMTNQSQKVLQFLSYGRLLERKGFQDAIQAFSEVVKKYPNCTLTIYGEGSYRGELEKLIKHLGLLERVFLPGKFGEAESPNRDWKKNEIATPSLRSARNDATTILLENDCFLFPSWYEGFSGALVEAMMAGIPIIASDIPMNLEAVRDEESALVFPVGNSEVLSQRMIQAIEYPDKMVQLGAKARQEAVERFDIEKIAKEYEGVVMLATSSY